MYSRFINLNQMDNIILTCDSYKVTHHLQYPLHTEYIYSYFESRGGQFDEVVFFGLQYLIKKWLSGKVVTEDKIMEAKEIYQLHFSTDYFNEEGWRYILTEYNGHLPVKIKAVPEGYIVPVKNVLFTVENTDPKCFWLTNYLETLLVQVWYPITVATISREMKKIIKKKLEETSDDLKMLNLKLHDFGFRGASSVESASIGGCAHLVNFQGTDNIAALLLARRYYGNKIAGYSIAATEHSTITSWGESNELNAYQNVLDQFPNATASCVSDSYNIWTACSDMWGDKLKEQITKRSFPLVIRPDSGDPSETVCKVLDILDDKFGSTSNKKGYKMLPNYIRVIQGDGIDVDSLENICENIKQHGYSIDNLTFGCGGGLLQKMNRDTQKCAYKCSHAIINGESINVFKDPISDSGKQSKKGRLTLERTNGRLETIQEGKGDINKDILVTVFENGKLLIDYSLDQIRNNAQV